MKYRRYDTMVRSYEEGVLKPRRGDIINKYFVKYKDILYNKNFQMILAILKILIMSYLRHLKLFYVILSTIILPLRGYDPRFYTCFQHLSIHSQNSIL
jgi:hypothetical protein